MSQMTASLSFHAYHTAWLLVQLGSPFANRPKTCTGFRGAKRWLKYGYSLSTPAASYVRTSIWAIEAQAENDENTKKG